MGIREQEPITPGLDILDKMAFAGAITLILFLIALAIGIIT